jgi:ferritin-like metal-binding protein YciE
MDEDASPNVLDAALIASAQRVEHYEIAAYGCVATYAEMLGYDQVHKLLGQTLNEEEMTDQKLSELAESIINVDAEVEAPREREITR